MPFTPLHFGPGLAIKVIGRERISFLVFVLVQILTDLETLYNLRNGYDRIHTFWHTYAGATVLAVATAAVVYASIVLIRHLRTNAHPHPKESRPHLLSWLLISALLGTWSHVLLDSVMHADVVPFAPLLDGNALLGVLSATHLNLVCVGLGGVGLYGVFIEWVFRLRDV